MMLILLSKTSVSPKIVVRKTFWMLVGWEKYDRRYAKFVDLRLSICVFSKKLLQLA